MKIVFLGNFKFPFSTESHHAWTWEKMGHTVVRLQENSATTDQVLAACVGAQLFQILVGVLFAAPSAPKISLQLPRI